MISLRSSLFALTLCTSTGTACDKQPESQPAQSEPSAQSSITVQAAKATIVEYKQLLWLAGAWRGSGGEYRAFYEEYRPIDDSTMLMRSFTDSTQKVASDSSTIGLRGGAIESRSARSVYVAIELTPTSVRFAPRSGAGGGHTFAKVSADVWTATLHPATPGGRTTVYTMRRMNE